MTSTIGSQFPSLTRIESTPEIEAVLKSILDKLDADAAILYKFIDIEDLEGTELLQLLNRSPLTTDLNNNIFTSNKIDDKQLNLHKNLEELICKSK